MVKAPARKTTAKRKVFSSDSEDEIQVQKKPAVSTAKGKGPRASSSTVTKGKGKKAEDDYMDEVRWSWFDILPFIANICLFKDEDVKPVKKVVAKIEDDSEPKGEIKKEEKVNK